MKKIKSLLLLVVFIALSGKSFAQDESRPWAIGVGVNAVDVAAYGIKQPFNQLKDYAGLHDLNMIPVLSRIYVAKYLKKGFTLDLAGSINSINRIATVPGKVPRKNYYSLDLGVRYDLNNWFGETGWFDPYVKLGLGGAWVDNDNLLVVSPTLGFNTWFNDRIGLNFESAYKTSSPFRGTPVGSAWYTGAYHFQHSISLVFKFGAKDTDKDGVIDSKDLCPLIAGKKELFGCTDIDGDGVADKEDECPELVGTLENKGCPDTDNDGILDKDDNCPDLAGDISTNGCPDTDGDGVSDDKDKCPELAGTKATKGCPDTDGDGVADKDDQCANEKGDKSSNGCPEVSHEEKALIKTCKENTVKFQFGKYEITSKERSALDSIAQLMKKSKTFKLKVEGHTDSVGSESYNKILSKKRADSVVKYLISKGVDSSRLESVGYGELKPIASNKTAAGRAQNRRVQFDFLK